jgi:TonB family protein
MSIRELITADRSSPWYRDDAKRVTLDAQAWAFLHMLLFADETNQRGALMTQFIEKLQNGADGVDAFTSTFGEPETFQDEFAKYINRPLLTFRRAQGDLQLKREQFPVETLSPENTAIAIVNAQMSLGMVGTATTTLNTMGASTSTSPRVLDTQAQLDENGPNARASFQRAVDAGSTNFYSDFGLAGVLIKDDNSKETLERAAQLLGRSRELNPQYPWSALLLSQVKAALGDSAEALELAKDAVALGPANISARLTLASALAKNGEMAQALLVVRGTQSLADSDAERQNTDKLFKQLVSDAQAALPAIPPAPPVPVDAVRVGGSVKAPEKTKDVRPVYPEIARAIAVQGVVILEVAVGADGKVTGVRVLKSEPFLDAAAVTAVSQWEYAPTLVDGKAVPVVMTVTQNFALR